jgi:maltose/moltooligosaccharide transporter
MRVIWDKPRLSLGRVLEMNIGFFGLQFSFGLQQSNMGPIYGYLGAHEAAIPLLFLAGPMTGLIVQPIVGAMSDRTTSRLGRRTPYFLVGALVCSLCLFLMPFSPTLLVAASLLWLLDAGNNITQEPYRAYVSDRLAPDQRPLGFLAQASFTGLAQTLSYLSPSLLVAFGWNANLLDANGIPIVTHIAFTVGAVLSVTTILWSVLRVRELPLSAAEHAAMRAQPRSVAATLAEIGAAIREMPAPMRALALPMLCQWYAMFCYWQYIPFSLARSLFGREHGSAALRDATLANGQLGGFYNFIAFAGAFALVPLVRRFGARPMHAVCLAASGCAMIAVPMIASKAWLFVPMLGLGLGWASMMGTTYVMLSQSIPPARTGVYMGIFNMFIVVPMLIQSLTAPLYYDALLGGDARNMLRLAGVLMIAGAVATVGVRAARPLAVGA